MKTRRHPPCLTEGSSGFVIQFGDGTCAKVVGAVLVDGKPMPNVTDVWVVGERPRQFLRTKNDGSSFTRGGVGDAWDELAIEKNRRDSESARLERERRAP